MIGDSNQKQKMTKEESQFRPEEIPVILESGFRWIKVKDIDTFEEVFKEENCSKETTKE